MSYALIDNATLTGVQRISGQVPTRTTDSVDTDIIALENLVQAIFFYDRVVAIDNYMPQYRDERIAAFPFITFLNATSFNLDSIEEKAFEVANQLKPEIRGGEFANDDFKNLFELLKTHIICTWDISSSIYYLTLKCLAEEGGEDFKKYSNLAAGIFSELFDASCSGGKTKSDVELIDRYGNPITDGYKIPQARWGDGSTGGETGAVKAFVASLVWLANRSIFYSLSAKYLKADTFLYPIRQAYQQYYMSKTCNYGFDYTKRIVKHFSEFLSQDLIEIQQGGLATATGIDLPVFSAWLAKKTGDPGRIIDAAFQMRNEPPIVEAREQMREVRRLFDESEIREANNAVAKLVKNIEKSSSSIRVKYGIETRQGVPVTRLVHIYNTYAALKGLPKLPSYDFKIKLPEFFYNISDETGFSSVYRNVSKDLSTIWSLGEARDILGSRVVKDTDAKAYNPKSEAPQYRNSHSQFKSPM